MSDPTETPPAWNVDTDPPSLREHDVYDVTGAPDEYPELRGVLLPRRHNYGGRGVLLVDRPAGLVFLLDADDQARTFRYRDHRPLAGDPANTEPPAPGERRDDITRAAYQAEYDVTAAPWVGAEVTDSPESPPRPRRPRSTSTAKGKGAQQ